MADPGDIADPRAFRWVESGISGLARARQWDTVTTAACAGEGDEAVFVAVSPDDVVRERGSGEIVECARRALAPVVEPPYRAVAVRRSETTWAIGAVAVEVVELPADLEGEELTLTVAEDGSRMLEVDGRRALAGMEALERVASGRYAAYVLRAARLAGALWEVRVDPL